jgi:hypothetical protein
MYEMEGPRGLAARTGRLRGPPCVTRPPPNARNPPEAPAARFSLRSGISPGWSRFRWPAAGAGDPPEVPVTRLI